MLYIFGKGGYSVEVLDLVKRCQASQEYCFIDDNYNNQNDVLARRQLKQIYKKSDRLIVAVGNPAIRKEIADWAKSNNYGLQKFIDPTAILGADSVIGYGTLIFPFSSISSLTSIGNNCIINWSTNVGHHVEIGDNSFISSKVNIGGGCKIGDSCLLGMGALIREGVTIGNNSTVGMGSVVFRDIPSGSKVIGNPARITK